jgi:hypothetical protein
MVPAPLRPRALAPTHPSGRRRRTTAITISTPPAAIPAGMSEGEAAALPLSPRQRIALIKLTQGASYRAAADAAGVTRQTVHEWMKADAHFKSAFNAWQHDALTTSRDRLLAGTADATTAVLEAIRAGDVKSAWKLLEAMNVTEGPTPGTTDAGLLSIELELQRQKELIRLRQMKSNIEFAEIRTDIPSDD